MNLLHEPMHRAIWRGRVMRPWRRHQFAGFGPDSILDRPEWIYGAHHIEIGEGVVFLRGARLSAEKQTWDEPGPSIVVGPGTMFRTFAVISASTRVEIGANVLAGSYVSIIDSDHTITDGWHNPLFNPVLSSRVTVGECSWLGERATILRGTTIGKKCIVAAHSVVRGEVPDFSVVAGAPARVVGSTRPPGESHAPEPAHI